MIGCVTQVTAHKAWTYMHQMRHARYACISFLKKQIHIIIHSVIQTKTDISAMVTGIISVISVLGSIELYMKIQENIEVELVG